VPTWDEYAADMARAAGRQMFFVGGAPRSGTTWLQQMLDAHPEVSCRGEGLFLRHIALPLDKLVAERRQAIAGKNERLFRHTSGYDLPAGDEADAMLAAGVLLSLARQTCTRDVRAVGEKTPENLFLFERLKLLFPRAKFIGIARDPRDLVTSAWHFFGRHQPPSDNPDPLIGYLKVAMPSLVSGLRTLVEIMDRMQGECGVVTYEAMIRDPAPALAGLFRLIGVSDEPGIVTDCIARTRFEVMTQGRPAGAAQNGEFLRSGTVGTWRETLTEEAERMINADLGWAYERLGWVP
jgi:hypothetical protein